jgi:hypothetical protein
MSARCTGPHVPKPAKGDAGGKFRTSAEKA